MYSLPTSITVDGREFHITNNGDFRMVLDCFNALNDEELGEDYRVLASLLIFFEDFNDLLDLNENQEILEDLVMEMYKFFNCGQLTPPGATVNTPVIDWELDSQLIFAAINNVAHYEIRSIEYLHWWTFMGYFLSIGESVLSNVVSIRNKIVKGKKLEKWEKEFKRDNPEYFNWRRESIEEREAREIISQIWQSGGE